MITYEEAKAKALKARPKITEVYEYKDAYVFVEGGEKWDSEIVILKSNGNAVSMSDYAAISTDDSEPKKKKL